MESDDEDSGLTHVSIIYLEYSTYNHTVNESQVLNKQAATMLSAYWELNVIYRVKYKCNDIVSICNQMDQMATRVKTTIGDEP